MIVMPLFSGARSEGQHQATPVNLIRSLPRSFLLGDLHCVSAGCWDAYYVTGMARNGWEIEVKGISLDWQVLAR